MYIHFICWMRKEMHVELNRLSTKITNVTFSKEGILLLLWSLFFRHFTQRKILFYIKSLIRRSALKSSRCLSRRIRRIIITAGTINVKKTSKVPSETLIIQIINCLCNHVDIELRKSLFVEFIRPSITIISSKKIEIFYYLIIPKTLPCVLTFRCKK